MRRSRLAATLIVATVASGVFATVPGQATSYRYWTYWSGTDTTWTFSAVGPASALPADGAVEGWRFAVSAGLGGQGAQPGQTPAAAFGDFCAETPQRSGTKRVAVLIDFGGTADAPSGQSPPNVVGHCAQVPLDFSGSQILQQVAEIRSESGLVCAIAGYPAGECAPAVADSGRSPSAEPSDSKRGNAATSRPKAKESKPTAAANQPEDAPSPQRTAAKPTATAESGESGEGSSPPVATKKSPQDKEAAQRNQQSRKPTTQTLEPGSASVTPSEDLAVARTEASGSDGAGGPSLWTLSVVLAFVGLAGWAGLRYRRRWR